MFDRFDICEAYLMLEHDYGSGGWLAERGYTPSGQVKQVSSQLRRMGFVTAHTLTYETLSDESREIYHAFVTRHNLPEHVID
jgi:hypothetical protein